MNNVKGCFEEHLGSTPNSCLQSLCLWILRDCGAFEDCGACRACGGLSAASVLRPPPPPPPTEGPGLGFLPAKVPQSRAGPSKAHRQLWGCSARVGVRVRGAGGWSTVT